MHLDLHNHFSHLSLVSCPKIHLIIFNQKAHAEYQGHANLSTVYHDAWIAAFYQLTE